MVSIPVLQRHPNDGWALARPMKVGVQMRRILLKLADALLPPNPRLESTVEDVTRHALICLQYMPRSSAWFFLAGMRLLNWSPLWRLRGVRPLTSLPSDAARRQLVSASQSRWLPVRLLMYGPLGLFMSSYFDQDYVHQALGYSPVPFITQRIELRRAWVLGQEPGADQEIRHLPVRTP